jgi:stage II sporulation protein D
MKKIKPLIVLASLLFAVTLIVPAILVLPFSEEKVSGKLGEKLIQTQTKTQTKTKTATEATAPTADADAGVEVGVYRFAKSKIETIPLEDYLVGVVASEMPADFQEEALKAQALTARTYIVRQLMTKQNHLGLPQGAQVGDTEMDQVYSSDDQLRQEWGAGYSWKRKKILDAVRATSGQILTFNGEPIQATFFSTSNGYTENSEDYWPSKLPYLRSVTSPWDQKSPMFSNLQILTVKDFETKLGVHLNFGSTIGQITERTAGKRVGKVNFSGKALTGKEIREKLDLKSSDFTWERKGANIIIKTKGYGHGVGMSQYGANGMAAEGKTYQDIVKHYYTGVNITSSASMLAMITKK